ncbi:MAG: TetR family transcriptional regulator [Thermoleophilia bacterium]|jgi:AcrR family transcriptional regulator|nr:TetR family transcriptional regulator [Thermoleophilia bacterium]MBJ7333064.1 TetR family transcriptional regulator [Thermoleophilia bacterium]
MTDQLVSAVDRSADTDRPSQILDCACVVIARDGAEGLRMAAVAREANVSNALLHYYFATREELIRQAFEYHDRRETRKGNERVEQIADPIERIRDVLSHELAEDAAVREGWILWSEMQRLAMFNEALRSSVADRSTRWVGGVATMIRVAQNDGSVSSEIDADAAALRLTALVDGLGGHVIVQSRTRAEALAALEQSLVSELGLAGVTA